MQRHHDADDRLAAKASGVRTRSIGDNIFAALFFLLAVTTAVFDLLPVLGVGWAQRILVNGYAPCDPLFVVMPPFYLVGLTASALLWGPL